MPLAEGKLRLCPSALTREGFAPFGDVIETQGASHFAINDGTIERYHDLAEVIIGQDTGVRPLISIAKCNVTTVLPHRIVKVERHPLGSQAFIPLSPEPFICVVAPMGEQVEPAMLRAFVSNGHQGINYRPGIWHLPLISQVQGQEFLVVDRGGPGTNCDEFTFDEGSITLMSSVFATQPGQQ